MFVVGTERRKTWKQRIKLRPKPSELGPISEMKFMSTARRARMTMRRNTKRDNPEGESTIHVEDDGISDDDEEATNIHSDGPDITRDDSNQNANLTNTQVHPDYKKIWSLMEAADCVDEDCKFAGTQLLSLRANNQLNALGAPKKTSLNKTAKKEWSILQKISKDRSRNYSKSQLANLQVKSKESDGFILLVLIIYRPPSNLQKSMMHPLSYHLRQSVSHEVEANTPGELTKNWLRLRVIQIVGDGVTMGASSIFEDCLVGDK